MALIYKTLFEIKILHEFYLTDSKGESVFDFADQPGRMNFLLSKFSQNRASVNDDLTYQVPVALQSVFDNYHLKLLTTYSGFKVAIEVTAKTLPDGTLVYTPKIKLPEDLNIIVCLLKKNTLFDNLSNAPISKAVPAIYYFTNEDLLHTRTFPFLTSVITPFDAAAIYEQGELASYGINDTRQFYNDGTSDQWNTIKGNHFANKTDLLLVTPAFNYMFSTAENITDARFVLKNASGTIVRTVKAKNNNPLSKVNLNFNPDYNEEALICLPAHDASEENSYTLEVTINGGVTRKHTLIFWDNDVQFKNYWSLVNVKPIADNSNFNLLDINGYLKTRKLSTGVWQPAPVFEIAVKSRFLYWRYKNDKHRKLTISGDITDFVDKVDDNLVLKKPKALTYIPSQFKATDSTYHHLPNPATYDSISSINKRLFLDILVSESKMFPAAPG